MLVEGGIYLLLWPLALTVNPLLNLL